MDNYAALQGLNLVMVYSPDGKRLLFVKRTKEPYLGLYNFPGGKIEAGESGPDSAYRELFEETGITREDIRLTSLMDSAYPMAGCLLRVYAGRLSHEVKLTEEAHPLEWLEIAGEDFSDMTRFAGEGNIKHMVECVRLHREEIF